MAKATTQVLPKPDIDLLADAEDSGASARDLQQIITYCEEQQQVEADIAKLKEQVKERAERLEKLQLNLIPDLMLALNIKKFSLASGYVVEVKGILRGTIPTTQQIDNADEMDRPFLIQRRNEALAWLRDNNAASIIKNQVVAEFGAGEDEAAKKFFASIQAQGYRVKCEEEVNFMTLNSYFKQARENGKVIPAEAFGLFEGNKATIKEEKVKKVRA